jgi:hypothetical protein
MRVSKAGASSSCAEIRTTLDISLLRRRQPIGDPSHKKILARVRFDFWTPLGHRKDPPTQPQCLTVQMLQRRLTSLLGRAAPFASPRPCSRCFAEAAARYGDQAHFKTEAVFGKKHAGFDRARRHKKIPGKRPSIPGRGDDFSLTIEETTDPEVKVRRSSSR